MSKAEVLQVTACGGPFDGRTERVRPEADCPAWLNGYDPIVVKHVPGYERVAVFYHRGTRDLLTTGARR